jgi:hypothetical protein
MAEHRTPTTTDVSLRTSAGAVYWRYLIFWLLLFGLTYFISLYGIVAEA